MKRAGALPPANVDPHADREQLPTALHTNGPLILIEFNELSPVLIDRFIRQGQLPNFARFHQESEVYLTEPEERAPYLEPWIQWITVHSGLNYREHRIFNLGDGHRVKQKCLWDLLSEANYRVWVCGSMNVRYDTPLNGWILPDPWTTQIPPYPAELSPYFSFVQRHVLEYTRDSIPVTLGDRLRFLKFMLAHGLSASTAIAIIKQLGGELLGLRRSWRRATILDRLQFDLFRSQYRRLQPHFSTFFVNSTAHFQHFYWRYLEPGVFKLKPSIDEHAEFADAVLFGYQEMDRLLAKFIELGGKEAILILCTGLSQQPCLTYEDKGGKVIYRPRDFDQLLRFAGVQSTFEVAPVMAEQFYVHFNSSEAAATAERLLRELRVDGREALGVRREGASLFCGCNFFTGLAREATLQGETPKVVAPFFDLFYQIEGMKSGMHHPDGIFWLRWPNRAHRVHGEKLRLDAIAPMILEMFGISAPARPDAYAAAREQSQPATQIA